MSIQPYADAGLACVMTPREWLEHWNRNNPDNQVDDVYDLQEEGEIRTTDNTLQATFASLSEEHHPSSPVCGQAVLDHPETYSYRAQDGVVVLQAHRQPVLFSKLYDNELELAQDIADHEPTFSAEDSQFVLEHLVMFRMVKI